jgi:hypothetical protein
MSASIPSTLAGPDVIVRILVLEPDLTTVVQTLDIPVVNQPNIITPSPLALLVQENQVVRAVIVQVGNWDSAVIFLRLFTQ